MRGYVVVFLGYSADDPPIHYLLEGLRRTRGSSSPIYAFQADESDEALARWRHKGVEAVPYARVDAHRALWETLELWADRADDPISWRRTIVDLAMDGPEKLQPHQRGQLAHIVSTYEGARDFTNRTPPAEWLCVFDPSCRYSSPGRSDAFDSESPLIDPFTLYGLDSDAAPERSDPDSQFVTRDIPSNGWDAFAANSLDRQDLSDEALPSVRGYYARHVPRLPRRLECLGTWIARVANQPAAVWWAVRQDPLHLGIRKGIAWELEQSHEKVCHVILRTWRYLLESWESTDHKPTREWHHLKREIDRQGWGSVVIRRFTAITRPYLKADPALMSRTTPPKKDADLRIWDLVRFEVVCADPPGDADIPDEWLEHVIRALRKNLELAVQLCEEVDDMHRFHIAPIAPDGRPDISEHGRTHGLSGYVIWFASLFERLVQLDISKARREFSTWPTHDDTAFSRLRIWAGGKPELAKPDVFCEIMKGLSDDAFWSDDHQRDLLLVLAKRWGSLPEESRKQIEDRLLKGPAKWKDEDNAVYEEHRAWATLERLQWLANNECEFSFDLETEIAKRSPAAPTWKRQIAEHAADSREMRGGWVATNTEHAVLLREPIDSVLSRARELSGQTEGNALEMRDPFAGLCDEHPVRAYLALAHAARRKDYPEWAWKSFLLSSSREKDAPKFSATIAERLCRFPDEELIKLLYPSTWWLQKVGKSLPKECPDSFDKTVSRLIDVLHLEPWAGRSAIISGGRSRDWVTEALNSPVGYIARAIFENSRVEAIGDDVDPSADWLGQLARLLALSGDPRRHAIAIIAHDLGRYYHLVPEWTERHLLSILDAEDEEDREALWAGFLWNARVASEEFFLRLKPGLLTLAKQRNSSREGHVQSLAYLVLRGWITPGAKDGHRHISNAELRDVLLHGGDDFRSHTLWQIERGIGDSDESNRKEWLPRAVEFFRHVWPRQKAVKSPAMSVRLCELLLSNRESFPELLDVVLPFLTKIDRGHGPDFEVQVEFSRIVEKHPERFLGMLHTILSDDVSEWPYGIGDVLEKIGEADRKLLSDARLQELKRKWNAR